MADLVELSSRFRNFALTTAARAPLYAALSTPIADDADLVALLAAAPEEQQGPVLLFAAVHDLLLGRDERDGEAAALAAFYPNLSSRAAEGDPFPAFRRLALARADALRAVVSTRSTQTNEVGRCAQFLPVFGLLEAEVGPLAMLDVGTSAGLNLLLPRYSYHFEPGGDVSGDGGGEPSTVRLVCGTRDGVPVPATMPTIAAAVGIDRSPIDVHDDAAVRWLEACVWPDQADRFERLVAAIALARRYPPDVRRGDAITDVPAVVEELAASGHPVVTNSWVLNYFTEQERLDYVAMLDRVGATRDLSWVIAESPALTTGLPVPTETEPEVATVVSAVRWRGGRRTVHRLATTHPHGFWLRWERPVSSASGAASPPPW